MNSTKHPARFSLTLAVALLAFGGVVPAGAQTEEDLKRIEDALPAQASAKPEKPRNLLVFTLTKGFKHQSIPFGEKAIEAMGRKTGAFTAKVSQDLAEFDAENLKQYDAVLMLNTTGELFTEESQRDALLQFVREGKGLAGIHAATDCCYEWRPYGEMIGGYFDGHPWNAGDTVVIKIEDPDHPVMKAFKDSRFTVQDEIYQMKDPYSRERLNVLSSLDTQRTTMTKNGIKRTDGDFPISWVREYGKGRVFYCSLGHNPHIYWDPTVLQHYLDGLQFAMGDLKAPAVPDRELTVESVIGRLPAQLAEASQTTYSESFSKVTGLEELVLDATRVPGAKPKVARQLAKWLRENASGTTEALRAKQAVGRKLGEIGGDEVVPDLEELLKHSDGEVVEIARRALEKIPGEAAAAALRRRVGSAQGVARIGVINSLGARRDAQSVGLLSNILKGSDAQAAAAAATALGKIGTTAAADALAQAQKAASGRVLATVVDAYLSCADQLRRDGDIARAGSIYQTLYESALPSYQRVPAFLGMVEVGGAKGRAVALRELLSQDLAMRDAAAGFLAQSEAREVGSELTDLLRVAPAERQIAILDLLGARQERVALPAVLEQLNAGSPEVRVAALRTLGRIGDGGVVKTLASVAAGDGAEAERQAARDSLAILAPVDVDPTLLKLVSEPAAEPGKRGASFTMEVVKAVGARRVKAGVAPLLQTARAKEAGVAAESFKALAELAGPGDAPALLEALVATKQERARKEAERAVLAALRQIPDEAARPQPILTALATAEDAGASASLVRVLGNFGGAQALAKLREVRRESQDETVQDAVVRALAEFSTAEALPDVQEIARNSQVGVHQALAVRGLARMAALPSDRPSSETLGFMREALELARSTEDKRLVLGEVSSLKIPGALDLVAPLMENQELREDAMAAAVKLAPAELASSPDAAQKILSVVSKEAKGEETRKQAEEMLARMEKTAGYVLAWSVAGPFEAKGVRKAEALLRRSFEPEEADKTATWKPVLAGDNEEKPEMVDLSKAVGGRNRVAYLRTRVWAPAETTASLELGSDDGLSAWLNGDLIHSTAGTRPYKPGTDKLPVSLHAGWNTLMLKVSQTSGGWGASARLVGEDGKRIESLKVDSSQVGNTAEFLTPGATLAAGGEIAGSEQTQGQ